MPVNTNISPIQKAVIRISGSTVNTKTFLKNFTQGRTFKGKVVKALSDSRYSVRVEGNELTAKSVYTLRPGSVYHLRVTNPYPNVTVTIVDSGVEQFSIEDTALRLLQQMHIETTPLNRAFAEQLLLNSVQPDAANLAALSELYSALNKNDLLPRDETYAVKLLVYLYAKGIVITGASLALFQNYPALQSHAAGIISALLNRLPGDKRDESGLKERIGEIFGRYSENLDKAVREFSRDEVIAFLRNAGRLYEELWQQMMGESREPFSGRDVMKLLLFMLTLIGKAKTVNYEAPFQEQPYYLPLILPVENNIVFCEVSYRDLTHHAENDETVPGFEIHLLITIDDAPPLHIMLTKKTQSMLNIMIAHPIAENMELLRSLYPAIKRALRPLGFAMIRIAESIEDTTSEEYRSLLYLPQKHIVKKVNITG